MEEPIHIHMFHKDLRLFDNNALKLALNHYTNRMVRVVPICILDNSVCDKQEANFSIRKARFLIQSLINLHTQIEHYSGELYVFKTKQPEQLINVLISSLRPQSISWNAHDTCQFSFVKELVKDVFISSRKQSIVKSKTFTTFKKKILEPDIIDYTKVVFDANNDTITSIQGYIAYSDWKILYVDAWHCPLKGGRRMGLEWLRQIKYKCRNYMNNHMIPSKDCEIKIQVYLDWGCLSIGEVVEYLEENINKKNLNSILKTLYSYLSYTSKAVVYPGVVSLDIDLLLKWCRGKTRIPFIDAGLRQLLLTGLIHHKVKDYVMSYLVHKLQIHKFYGIRWFDRLSIINYNWDAIPDNLNLWHDSKQLDPRGKYIKKWVTELKDSDIDSIHHMNE